MPRQPRPFDITAATRRNRRELLRRDSAAAADLAQTYDRVRGTLKRGLRATLKSGGVERINRTRAFVERAEQLFTAAAARTHATTTAGTVASAKLGRSLSAAQLTHLVGGAGGLDILDEDAIVQMVAATRSGPLRDLLVARGGQHADEVIAALRDGIALGADPADVAAAMDRTVGGALHNSLTIARTEMMRAHREATRLTLLRNRRHTPEWEWVSGLDETTCGFCWAQHGTVHSVDEPMAAHPRCRCVMRARTPGMLSGVELFDALTAEEQAAVLGPAKAAAFADGLFTLPELVTTGRHPLWGPTGGERSLTAVIGAPTAARYIADARRRK